MQRLRENVWLSQIRMVVIGVKTIVLTGGPCAGKSSVLAALKATLIEQVAFASEAAGDVLQYHGLPQKGWTDDDWLVLQRHITNLQMFREHEAANLKSVVVCDRGVFDNLAYPMGHNALVERGIRHQHDRYDLVIHLESLAVADPSRYEELARGNASRYETLAEAQAQEAATLAAWDFHRNRVVLSGQLSIDELARKCRRLVSAEAEAAA